MAKKEGKMFHNLEEERIVYEEKLRQDRLNEEKKQAEQVEEVKPYLKCPWCDNIQYDLNSRDVTSFWCYKCGRCTEAHWQ